MAFFEEQKYYTFRIFASSLFLPHIDRRLDDQWNHIMLTVSSSSYVTLYFNGIIVSFKARVAVKYAVDGISLYRLSLGNLLQIGQDLSRLMYIYISDKSIDI